MRTNDRNIAWTSVFKKDFKREKKRLPNLEELLAPVLSSLVADKPLDENYRDHALSGDKKPFRDCHLKPDLLLIYYKPDEETLTLVRLASHAELNL